MYQWFRISVSVFLWMLVLLSMKFGIPYIVETLKLQEDRNHHQVWASCILLAFLVLIITLYFLCKSRSRYHDANATIDYYYNSVLVIFFLFFSCIINSFIAYFCDTRSNNRLKSSSCIYPCENLKCARILTYLTIGLVFNALHLLILCGYAIILALVASPFHAMPLLLLYLFCIYMFVITVSESMKGNIRTRVFISLLNCFLSGLLIYSYFIMVTLIGEYSKDEGLWSVAVGLLPTSIHILVGIFIREVVCFLSSKDKKD